ncbi:MAG TPA: imidazoleglycerol-phosphate dehydratase HisB [Spirochaetota bacterium]|nr:imidazoleglycerol-phosphate dehydratase HisB [Spirochaetota bacterium]HPJ36238.1 imidazoleglycerol-phosphate dehydratase HisB [Spirochaetota bacterium]
MSRTGFIERKTSETEIHVRVVLDSVESSSIDSGVPFFDHMLNSMSRHGRFHLELSCKGDIHIDDHHTVEDIGICIGKAFKDALGNKTGIRRFGHAVIPMDESLTMVAIDISGRSFFKYSGCELKGTIKSYSEELTLEFLRSFADNAELNLHVEQKYGDNRHHIHESIYKALGVALFNACSLDPFLEGIVPSTKGAL